MTDKELLQEALELMEAAIKAGDWKVDGACDPDMLFNSIRSRLAQPKKEWVGLTDEEREEIALELPIDAVRITEAKLKEKNSV